MVQALAAREVPAYCPRVLEPRLHVRAPRGPVPLFPSYVFAHCVVRERFAAVAYCSGASGIVRFGEQLGAVDDGFIATLREREGEQGYVVVAAARRPPVKGTLARVVRGPLQGIEGIVTHYVPAKDRVRLLLTLVSGVRNVEVDARDLRPA